jgi:hypothetical protein
VFPKNIFRVISKRKKTRPHLDFLKGDGWKLLGSKIILEPGRQYHRGFVFPENNYLGRISISFPAIRKKTSVPI